ncbi:MAG: tRNA (adenosine(37)-N6)-dimethylallyltransferase MiaA [Mariprofundales bacterium]|nr:tRNA (adenosine(37)-N6)-dimethylallyltransferase MiaA [Mariprofundales bacterium]
MTANRPLRAVALMGATGCGKSALALALAQQFSTTIISCDSMQLYCGLDIGTAKPDTADRQRVEHAMIDVVTLPDSADAMWWAEQARMVIAACNREGRVPIVVGGTGLYLRALVEGFAPIPPEDPVIRERICRCRERSGLPYLYRMLCRVDPPLAARLPSQDNQRIVRALVVAFSSHKPLSWWQQQPAVAADISCPIFVLEMERSQLYQRLEQRFKVMIAQGWLQEVEWLYNQHLTDYHPAMRAVGYRQLLAHLTGECSLDDALQRALTATRHYAKRQQTWFRHQCASAIYGDAARLQGEIGSLLASTDGDAALD